MRSPIPDHALFILVHCMLRHFCPSCFFNSVCQSLAATPPLNATLLTPSSPLYRDDAITHGQPIQTALLHFLQTMSSNSQSTQPVVSSSRKHKGRQNDSSSNNRVVVPSTLLSSVQALNPLFRGNRQHDAHELLRTLLGGICMEKEEQERKRRRVEAMLQVQRWSCEHVRAWIQHFELTQEQTILSNIEGDQEHRWDGAFIVFLLNHWNEKAGKKPRVTSVSVYVRLCGWTIWYGVRDVACVWDSCRWRTLDPSCTCVSYCLMTRCLPPPDTVDLLQSAPRYHQCRR